MGLQLFFIREAVTAAGAGVTQAGSGWRRGHERRRCCVHGKPSCRICPQETPDQRADERPSALSPPSPSPPPPALPPPPPRASSPPHPTRHYTVPGMMEQRHVALRDACSGTVLPLPPPPAPVCSFVSGSLDASHSSPSVTLSRRGRAADAVTAAGVTCTLCRINGPLCCVASRR